MRTYRKGFTLVEILIVVVILGILAAIVVPQFTSASTEAVKGALQSQLQTVSSQLELYRVRNTGAYPTIGSGEAEAGWGAMVSNDYLKEQPLNGYTGETDVDAGDEADAEGETRESTLGWFFDTDDASATYGQIFAAGYDATNNLLFHEEGFGEDPE